VDNASTDRSLDLVNQYFPAATVIRNADNTGFCIAHNQAIRASKGAYYMALNSDVIMQPEYLSSLVSALEERPDYGSAAGKLLQPTVDNQTPISRGNREDNSQSIPC
jgi:GT2 family glycosyltransferase